MFAVILFLLMDFSGKTRELIYQVVTSLFSTTLLKLVGLVTCSKLVEQLGISLLRDREQVTKCLLKQAATSG